MDLNITVLAGRLASKPEIRVFDGGSTLCRYLVTVRSTEPRNRIDVIPVVQWDPDPSDVAQMERGEAVWVAGQIQRRFWSADDGRHSRIEIVALEVSRRDEEKDSQWAEAKMQHDLLPTEGANE